MMWLYVENPKDITRKFPEFINDFAKVVGYQKIYRNLLYFYTLN